MTEDEAKTKWCPMARCWGQSGPVNRDGGKPRIGAMCLGSGCMMWRWLDEDDRIGYCGLAGQP
jgi:hypothetical protein